ncbi:hypothetical protein BS17DRAFT_691138 [Gyrodon lividus]|nr:hypothetical protein BS17DRAFT_691138 [Gyrodon lividus]
MGRQACKDFGIDWLAEEELKLRKGQANDCLHHLRMAWAEKSVLFLTELWHATMISLEADKDTLIWYRLLDPKHLKVSTTVSDPNAWGNQNSTLAWFWTMDVQRDSELNDWMSECMFQSYFSVAHEPS